MKRSRFTEDQIIGALREQEAGMTTAEVCRKHGISQPTFYAWKAKFGGMSVPDAKRLKALAREHTAAAIQTLVEALRDPKLKVQAAQAWLDRAWGKPPRAVHTEGQTSNRL